MKKFYTTISDVKAAKDDDHTIEFIASREVKDRDQEIIKISGINLKNYKKNPVILFSHRRGELPVGKAVKVTKSGDSLKIKVEFAVEEYPFAATVYKLVKGGYLNAVSIGFSADWEFVTYDEKKKVRTFNKTELFELSIVTVPANAEALSTGKSISKALEDKVIDDEEFKAWDQYLETGESDEDTQEDKLKTLEERLENLEAKLEEKEAQEVEDTYFDDILKEFKPAGGAKSPDTKATSLSNLLKALK